MLRALSGRRHRVITGLAFYRRDEDRLLTGYDLTYVTFRELTDEMIEGYLDQGTYLDKAGAYAVQEIGDAFVARMKGDYDNVVGFPVEKVRRLLARFTAPALAVEIEDIDFPSSDGKAESGGRKLLIPGAVPGEALLVQVVGERGAARVAETIRVERPSPRRAAPRCRHFGACGGCRFQHVEYGTQLELKERHLRRVLDEGGLPEAAAVGQARHRLAGPLRLQEQDGVRLRGEARGARARPQGEGHIGPPDLPPDAAARGMPGLRPGRRPRLPGLPRFRRGPRPRGLRAGHPQGPSPPSRPPGGEADGRAHGPPGHGRPAGDGPGRPGRPARRGRAGAQELRPRHQQPRLRPGRVRTDGPRRRRPVHRGEAGRALLPHLPAELLPDQHGRRGAPLPAPRRRGRPDEGQPRPGPLLRQRGHRALARGERRGR